MSKESQKTTAAAPESRKKIKAKIFSFSGGVQEFEDVALLRLRSEKYNILIMEDHLPLLGELKGSLEIVTENEQKLFENICGYYMHKKNTFELILKE